MQGYGPVNKYTKGRYHISQQKIVIMIIIIIIIILGNVTVKIGYTAILWKVVGKNVHATIPKGSMGYEQYAVPDNVAVDPTFVAFL